MIPAGRTYITPARAAKVLGVALETFQGKRMWEKFPSTVKSFARPGASRPLRLWDEEQFRAYADQRELPFDQQDIPVLPRDPQNRPADQRDGDLLDYLEAWESMPEDDRPELGAWKTYVKARSTTGPKADTEIEGTRYWTRGTIRTWNTTRPKGHGAARAGGRRSGDTNTVAIVRPAAVERVRRTAELLTAGTGTPAAVLAKQLVEEFGFTLRTGERLVADTQKGLGLVEQVAVLQQENWDQPRERVVKVVADELGLPPAVAAYLVDDVQARQAQGQPRQKKK